MMVRLTQTVASLVALNVSALPAPFWGSIRHDGRASACSDVPLPACAPSIVWRSPAAGAASGALLVDAAGSIILQTVDADGIASAAVWTVAGDVSVGGSFCGGRSASSSSVAGNPVILPSGCVAAPCISYDNGVSGIFKLVAVVGASLASSCSGVVPWTTPTLEKYDEPFSASMTTPIVSDDGHYITSVSANSEFTCDTDEDCYTYLSKLAILGGVAEADVGLAFCEDSVRECPGSGPYTDGVISANIFFAFNIDSPGTGPSTSNLYAVSLDTNDIRKDAPPAMAAGCVLSASTEGSVYCFAHGNVTGWGYGKLIVGPPLVLSTVDSGFVAVGRGPSALVVAASSTVLISATLTLSLVWMATLTDTATALVRDSDTIIVATTTGLEAHRVVDGTFLWSSVAAAGATKLVAAAPHALVAVVRTELIYLTGMPLATDTPASTPLSSLSPLPTLAALPSLSLLPRSQSRVPSPSFALSPAPSSSPFLTPTAVQAAVVWEAVAIALGVSLACGLLFVVVQHRLRNARLSPSLKFAAPGDNDGDDALLLSSTFGGPGALN